MFQLTRWTGILIGSFFITLLPAGELQSQQPGPDEWDIEVSRASSTVPLRFTATEGTWMSVDVSPDGNRIAFDLLGHIYEMPADGGRARAVTTGRSWNMFPRYSPDGASLAFTSDRSGSEDVWVVRLADGSLENISKKPIPVVRPTWSRSGRALYASALDQEARSTGLRFNLFGDSQQLIETETFQPVNQFSEALSGTRVFFEHGDQQLHASGSRIKVYDSETSEISVYRERPGGAFNPTVSPDGRLLAYGHRDDQETVVVVHDLGDRSETIVARGLDRDHQEYGAYYYGVSSNFGWAPDGATLYLAWGGKIRAVDVATGRQRTVEFEASVDRALDETLRLPVELPRENGRTRAHRWAHSTAAGIVFEALGDIYLHAGGTTRNLTSSVEHETSPLIDAAGKHLYYARWSDTALGDVYRLSLSGGEPIRLTNRPSQYVGLALSSDDTLAFFRGRGQLHNGMRLEAQTQFELVTRTPDGTERRVTSIDGTPNSQSRMPLTVSFGSDGWIYYTEFPEDKLTLRRIRPDGSDRRTLYEFPHGERAVVSPDLKWIAFREYHRSFVTPFEWIGKPVEISAYDKKGSTFRVDPADGAYMEWSTDGSKLSWPRGGHLYEKALEAVLEPADETEPATTEIAVTYEVGRPSGVVALTNATVLTMDAERSILDNATVLIERDTISAVGSDVKIPEGARIYDLSGQTIMPGMVDAHAHPSAFLSQSHVIEQRVSGISAALAHGVTTLYELYGTEEKEPWIRDMIQAGRMDGPRLLTVGAPMFGLREFRPRTYRPVDSYDDALEHARYSKAQGATSLKDYVNFTRADRHQLITAAREVGINVVCETAGNAPMNFTQIVDGMTGLEHSMGLTPLYDDVQRLFKASKIGVTPTLLVVYNGPAGQVYFDQSSRVWDDPKLLRFAREDELRGYRRVPHFWDDDLYAPEMAAEMKKLFDAGVLVNAGGHGQMLGLDMHWELELFVQGGFSPMDALQVATINPATYHGLGRQLGSIEVGKFADLLVLRSNPLDDIRNTKDIRWVMVGGFLYAGDDGARVWPDPKPAAPFYFQR